MHHNLPLISAPSTTTEAITTTSPSTTAATFTSSVTTHFTIPPKVTTTNTGEVRIMLMSNYYDILYNNNGVFWCTIIEFIVDGPYRTRSSSSNQIRSNSTRELVAWILVVILAVLLIVSLDINVIQAIWTRRIWKNN